MPEDEDENDERILTSEYRRRFREKKTGSRIEKSGPKDTNQTERAAHNSTNGTNQDISVGIFRRLTGVPFLPEKEWADLFSRCLDTKIDPFLFGSRSRSVLWVVLFLLGDVVVVVFVSGGSGTVPLCLLLCFAAYLK